MSTRPTVHISDDLAAVAGPLLRDAIGDAIMRSGRCRLGLSGGGTPRPTLAWLARALPHGWYPRLWVTWVDERHLEPGHSDTNAQLAREAWLDAAPAVGGLLSMSRPGTVDAAASAFASAFAGDFEGGLDVALLGVGEDGHVASLFPGHVALDAADDVVVVHDSPKPPAQRISLTRRVLDAAGCSVLLASGAGKAAALQRAWDGDRALPIGRLAPQGAYHWVLDAAAAGTLEQTT